MKNASRQKNKRRKISRSRLTRHPGKGQKQFARAAGGAA